MSISIAPAEPNRPVRASTTAPQTGFSAGEPRHVPRTATSIKLAPAVRLSAETQLQPLKGAFVEGAARPTAVSAVESVRHRQLTEGERQMVRGVFGTSIDVDATRIHAHKFIPFQGSYTAMTPFGSVYFPEGVYEDDFSKGGYWDKWLFLHELGHVWQHQSKHNVAIEAGILHLRFWKSPYDYDLTDGKELGRFNLEQQASIIADYAMSARHHSREVYQETLREFSENPRYRLKKHMIRAAERQLERTNRERVTIQVPRSAPVHGTMELWEHAFTNTLAELDPGIPDREIGDEDIELLRERARELNEQERPPTRKFAELYMRAKVLGMRGPDLEALLEQAGQTRVLPARQ